MARLLKYFLLVELIVCGLILIYNFYANSAAISMDIVNYGGYVFYEYTSRDVFTKRDVCIESLDGHKNTIVIYNSHSSNAGSQEYLAGRMSRASKSRGWPVIYKQGPVPVDMDIAKHPAYFIDTTCDGNLHHFLEDTLRGLYGLMSATGRINKTTPSQVFTGICKNITEGSCHSHSRYRDLALHLGVIPETYGCIHDIQPGICYRQAGFGYLEADKRSFYRYLTRSFNLSCNKSVILFVDRQNRRVINLQQLVNATLNLRLHNIEVKVARFEMMSVEEQIKTVYCTRVMVGVQGAGLQWVYFLQEHARLIEIGWKRWPSKYVRRGRTVGVKGTFINASANITINWTEYLKANNLESLSNSQKTELLGDSSLLFTANPYKFADAYIDVDEFLKHLST